MPLIGVMPLYDDEKESYWMLPGYMKMLEKEGAVSLMLPLTDSENALDVFLDLCDGFLLTGGHDVSPEFYNGDEDEGLSKSCVTRDKMEMYILRKAVELDKSILGICRGIQLMNVCFGGTLYQDLPTQFESKIDHHMKPPYDVAAHTVNIKKDSLLGAVIDKELIGVNSYHHQAIRKLSPKFEISAVSEDGLIEGIFMPDKKFVIGVQWHPEYSYLKDENSRLIVKAFVDAAK